MENDFAIEEMSFESLANHQDTILMQYVCKSISLLAARQGRR